jgi:hypothetical protein
VLRLRPPLCGPPLPRPSARLPYTGFRSTGSVQGALSKKAPDSRFHSFLLHCYTDRPILLAYNSSRNPRREERNIGRQSHARRSRRSFATCSVRDLAYGLFIGLSVVAPVHRLLRPLAHGRPSIVLTGSTSLLTPYIIVTWPGLDASSGSSRVQMHKISPLSSQHVQRAILSRVCNSYRSAAQVAGLFSSHA